VSDKFDEFSLVPSERKISDEPTQQELHQLNRKSAAAYHTARLQLVFQSELSIRDSKKSS
jgi:hypothetical protein